MLDLIAGNAGLRAGLAAALAGGRLGHSVLLCGEAGAGAGYVARCLAADYLYPQGGPAAEAVARGEAPECLEVRGEGASGEIRIDRIRQVRRDVFSTALSASGRVVIVYGAQAMNAHSANALLKVLEEPPEGVLFILTASSLAAVLPTIRSRCRAFAVAAPSPGECAGWLKAHCANLSPERAAFLAAVYDGHIGAALAAATQPARAQQLQDAQALAQAAAQKNEYECLRLLAGYEKDKPAARALLRDFCCLCAATLRRPGFTPLAAAPAGRAIARAGRTLAALNGNVNQKLALTTLGIKLARG